MKAGSEAVLALSCLGRAACGALGGSGAGL